VSDYGGEHQATRRALLSVAGPADPCWRCGRPLGPDPSKVHLDHTDDRAGYAGLAHKRCNEQAGGRLGQARQRARRERRITVAEAALALEISEDRRHCSIVAAGHLDGDLVLLELIYLDGTDPTAEVLRIRGERKVLAVVIDPHSHASTIIRPLEAAGVEVKRPASTDIAEAHGLFLDALSGGRVRHQGQAELTTAMRHLEARRLGGATAPERRGALVDVSPAVAAELAVWGLLTTPKIPAAAIF
jgi:hypothetical protein